MTEIFIGKIIYENEKCIVVETPFNPNAEVVLSCYVIPKNWIVEVIGVPEKFSHNFVCVGQEITVLRIDNGKFKLKFNIEKRGKS